MTPGQELHRLALTIHYDGTRFHGWQVQAVERTVQGEVEASLERLTGRRRAVVGSGRTDAGVHATGQVASVDVPDRWRPRELRRALNAVLPADLWIAAARRVRSDFHPRFQAVSRTYQYRLGSSEASASPLHRAWCWALAEPLDSEPLHRGAERIVGEHSFRAFAKSGQPERGDRCRIASASWEPWGSLGWRFSVTADRYLHHMVRYLVGTMVDAARGRRPVDDVGILLDQTDPELRTSAPAPPEGLFLTRVEYPWDVLSPEVGEAEPDGVWAGPPSDESTPTETEPEP